MSCLAMICRHYGKNYSLEYLDGFCHANIAGISMLGITDGAKSVGLNVMTLPLLRASVFLALYVLFLQTAEHLPHADNLIPKLGDDPRKVVECDV